MPYVYSTATSDSIFTTYTKTEPGQAGKVLQQVLIKGGANLAKGKGQLITKYGYRTEVTDHELELLKGSTNFQKMITAGFLRVDERKLDAEKIAGEMEPRDESAPLVPQDYHENDTAKPNDIDEEKPAPRAEESEENEEEEAEEE